MTTAVPYLRCSTDDRGQDPIRQMEVIGPWAARESVTLLDPVIDEGTSASKTDPFQRKKFLAACDRAKEMGADAIVVECSDRFSRQGAKQDGWAEIELGKKHGLRLLRADKPLAQHDTMVGNVGDAMHAEAGRGWVEEHKRKVRSGMANAKKKGLHVGRPPKVLTADELALVTKLRAEGKGWRSIAHAVSEGRGAYDVADPAVRRKREVSHMHIRRIVLRVTNCDA